MKNMILGFALTALLSPTTFAYEKTSATSNTGETAVTAKKSDRKKKVEMCGECGKPERECECHKEKGK